MTQYTRCDTKYGECLNKKKYYSKRHVAINPHQNPPPPSPYPASKTLILSFLLLAEAVLEVLFRECNFHGHFDFGEEPEVTRCQIR